MGALRSMGLQGRAYEMVLESFANFDTNGDGKISMCELGRLMKELDAKTWTERRLSVLMGEVDTNMDGVIDPREFLGWVFNVNSVQQKFREVIGITMDGPTLLRELMLLEGNPDGEADLMSKLQVDGCAVIVKISFSEHESRKLMALFGYLRALFALRVWGEDVRLIKPDDGKFFAYSHSPASAIRAAVKMQQLVLDFAEWLRTADPGFGDVATPEVKIGVAQGKLLLIEGDYYGHPVNVASKLGEDLASAGELFVQADCWDAACECDQHQPVSDFSDIGGAVELERCQAEISGVVLNFYKVRIRSERPLGETAATMPTSAELDGVSHIIPVSNVETCDAVVLVTDMSGFTKLTKKYGILHFLRLALKKRDMLIPLVSQHGGQFVKNDGDNVIATFPDCEAAVRCMVEVWELVAAYNDGREEDFQIRTGCALDSGEVAVLGKDIVGSAFENSFFLAEEISEPGDILATAPVREAIAAVASLAAAVEVSKDREVMTENGATKLMYCNVSQR